MQRRRISEKVYWMGAVDWDRRLFDSLIPLPDGTSYTPIWWKEVTRLLCWTLSTLPEPES